MSKINPSDSLNSSISLLEQKRNQDFMDLKQQLRTTGESMKPANLIKSAVRDISSSPQLKSILIKAAIGLAAGYIAKRLVTRQRRNNKNEILGNALQYGISFLAARQNNLLKSAGIFVANHLIETIKRRRMERRLEREGALDQTAEA
jgi:hypothetical protein